MSQIVSIREARGSIKSMSDIYLSCFFKSLGKKIIGIGTRLLLLC